MDAVIIMIITLILVIKTVITKEDIPATVLCENETPNTERVAKINDSYYEDQNAFSEIINALGFPKE